MDQTSLIWPMAAQVLLTFIVLIILPILRIAAVHKGNAHIKDYLFGDTENVPVKARLAGRNLLNLTQMPILFYVVCLAFMILQITTEMVVNLAWVYVALRVIHSLIHIGYNNVTHRFTAFLFSNLILFAMWVLLVQQVG